MTLPEALSAVRPLGSTVVTVGTFDGVHLGHRQLIGATTRQARLIEATSVALTFRRRPAEVLRPDLPSVYLCSLEERCLRLRDAGIDSVIVVEFTPDMAQLSAEDFTRTLVDNVGMRELVGGPDLALGHRREGTVSVLRDIGSRLRFSVTQVPELLVDGEPVRTSAVRRALEAGNVSRIDRILGRRYSVGGKVVRGDGRGRIIGVPTANVAVDETLALPSNGVYAVFFHVGGSRWPGAGNLGLRPTFDQKTRSLEIHLLDFEGDLYGQMVTVEFVERLRPEARFGGVAELVAQIGRDIQGAREVLARP